MSLPLPTPIVCSEKYRFWWMDPFLSYILLFLYVTLIKSSSSPPLRLLVDKLDFPPIAHFLRPANPIWIMVPIMDKKDSSWLMAIFHSSSPSSYHPWPLFILSIPIQLLICQSSFSHLTNET